VRNRDTFGKIDSLVASLDAKMSIVVCIEVTTTHSVEVNIEEQG
jgi:hypothetical protein